MHSKRTKLTTAVALIACGLCACTGRFSKRAGPSSHEATDDNANPSGEGEASDAGAHADAGPEQGDAGAPGFSEPTPLPSAVRKLKNVLTGLAPTDDDLARGTTRDGLRALIETYLETPQFRAKMLTFFAGAFQQSSFALADFDAQLRKRPGAFVLPYGIFGDAAFPLLFKNLQESFARTALALLDEGRPLNELLTTKRFMMTTALKSLYMQIEMPYDIHDFTFKVNHGSRPPIAETLDPDSPNYLVFGYEPPTTASGRTFKGTCAGESGKISQYPGNTYLFQVLYGAVPRDTGNNSAGSTNLGCMEHAMKPYISEADLNDWTMVTITDAGTPLRAYDLPALRNATTLTSKLPRVSFFSTPAFMAVWNTNDSNQHRVTANQALLSALGMGYSALDQIIPLPPTTAAIDGAHAVDGSECFACHKSLDPMRQFWGKFYDFNDKPDGKKSTAPASFGFGDVSANGSTLSDFGSFVAQVGDRQVAAQPVNRFALALTQKLCFFANSAKCEETDPEMRRVAIAFESASFDFKTLVRELFSSPLVTASESTKTFERNGVTVSIARREQLCVALANRLNRPDLCEIELPAPTNATTAVARLAGAISADAVSRGAEFPVTPAEPNLFYRAASELVCEAIASKVVDVGAGSVYASSDVDLAVANMVAQIMGVPPSDPSHLAAVTALRAHYDAAIGEGLAAPTEALRSTFAAACQSPTSLSIGL